MRNNKSANKKKLAGSLVFASSLAGLASSGVATAWPNFGKVKKFVNKKIFDNSYVKKATEIYTTSSNFKGLMLAKNVATDFYSIPSYYKFAALNFPVETLACAATYGVYKLYKSYKNFEADELLDEIKQYNEDKEKTIKRHFKEYYNKKVKENLKNTNQNKDFKELLFKSEFSNLLKAMSNKINEKNDFRNKYEETKKFVKEFVAK